MKHLLATLLIFCACSSAIIEPDAWHSGGYEPPTEDPFVFIVMTDRTGGCIDGKFEAVLDSVYGLQPYLVVFCGDLVQGSTDSTETERQYDTSLAIIDSLCPNIPFYFVIGNHDVDQWGIYGRRIGPTQYYFDAGGVRFVIADNMSVTRPYYSFGWQQALWIESVWTENAMLFSHGPWWENDYNSIGEIVGDNYSFCGHYHCWHIDTTKKGIYSGRAGGERLPATSAWMPSDTSYVRPEIEPHGFVKVTVGDEAVVTWVSVTE